MHITCRRVDWEFTSPFRIAYRVRTHAETIQVEVEENGVAGSVRRWGCHITARMRTC